jgi:hypothetical protein
MPAEFVDKNAAELPLPVRTAVRSATQTRALRGRGAPRRRLAKMMACGMMMVMMLTGTSTNCAQCYGVLSMPSQGLAHRTPQFHALAP